MHRVHVPDAQPPSVFVTGGEVVHLTRVLRLSPGDTVVVFDGRAHEWLGRIASVTSSRVTIELTNERTPIPEPSVHVTLGVAVLKGTQLDDVVRDATALGVSAIVPFVSAHVAVSERAWKNRSTDRWSRIASAAASQCGRAVVPVIEAVSRLESVLGGDGHDIAVACVEPASRAAQDVTALARPSRALLLIGPEGGWAPEELELMRGAGVAIVSLGPRTLRAETAPAVALSALWTHWGWS